MLSEGQGAETMRALVVIFRVLILVIALIGLAAAVVISLAAWAQWGAAAAVAAAALSGLVLVLSLGLSATLLQILAVLEEIRDGFRQGALRPPPAAATRSSPAGVQQPPVVSRPGDVIRVHKGHAILRAHVGVTVDGKSYPSAADAERAIDAGL
jgi:hypothetical protein